MPDARTVDESFLALPLSALADAALTRAVDLGGEHADFRVERIRTQVISLRDARLEASADAEDLGFAVRVVHDGTWGFAAGVDLTAAEAVRLAEEAVAVAKVSAAVNSERVELAAEPVYATAPGCRPTRSTRSRCPTPTSRACSPTGPSGCWPPTASSTSRPRCMLVKENKFYADTAGTLPPSSGCGSTRSSRRWPSTGRPAQFETMRTLAPPVGRGWEYLTGTGWDWDAELAEIPELLAEKMQAPSRRGRPRTTWSSTRPTCG